MRTLTIYVVSHADEPPLACFPTMKKATAYLQEMQADHGVCPNWRAEAHCFTDNSTGAAEMMNWVLGACSDALCAGWDAMRELNDLSTPRQELEVATPEVTH